MNKSKINLGLKELKKEWEPKGFKCEIYQTNSVESWSNPGHKTDEFIILIEGEMDIYFQGQTYYPAIGEIFKIPAKVPHKTRYGNSTCLYWIYAFDWQWNEDGVGIEEGKIRSPKVKSV
ncbi:MAG: hypothetical protein F6K56_01890 [Moorea sp. SIO3G5]|nr:hypothetical protein [Moorena sp. SIO3G5]